MRESLTYGSVRGVARKGHSYRDRQKSGVRMSLHVRLSSRRVPCPRSRGHAAYNTGVRAAPSLGQTELRIRRRPRGLPGVPPTHHSRDPGALRDRSRAPRFHKWGARFDDAAPH